MAKSGRFGLSLRILMVLAAEEGTMQTSAEIAKKLAESAVMVRRCFLLLHKKGLIEQRKGPNGGAKLKLPAKQIGIGDIYSASEGDWMVLDEPAIAGLLKRVREDGVQAMNETTLAQVLKRIRKNAPDAKAADGAAHQDKGHCVMQTQRADVRRLLHNERQIDAAGEARAGC